MKHNRTLAAIIACAMVVIAVFIGLQGKPVSRDDSLYLTDKAGVVSGAAETAFVQMQQNANHRLSVAIVKSTGKLSTADYCETLWDNWGLGTSDMLLLMVTGKQDYYFGYDTASSFSSLLDNQFDVLMERYLEPDFAAGNYEQAILTFSDGLQQTLSGANSNNSSFYPDEYYGGYWNNDSSFGFVSPFAVFIVIAFVVIFIAVIAAGSVGKRRPRTTVYRPAAPPPPRTTIRMNTRPAAPPRTAARPPRTTIRTSSRPSGSRPSSFGGGRSSGFGGSGRSSGGFGGGGRSGGMGGRGRR